MVFETPDFKYDASSTVKLTVRPFFFRKSNIAAIRIILLLAKQSHIIAIKKSFLCF